MLLCVLLFFLFFSFSHLPMPFKAGPLQGYTNMTGQLAGHSQNSPTANVNKNPLAVTLTRLARGQLTRKLFFFFFFWDALR